MKTIFRIILIGGLSYLVQTQYMYWSVAIVAFIVTVAIPPKSTFNAFISGFLGVGLLWAAFAWYIDKLTGSILTDKIALLFQLSNGLQLILITGVLGGILGGVSSVSGYFFRSLFKKKPSSYYR